MGQLLKKWPTLEQLQQAPAKQVAGLLQTNRISESRIKELAQLIKRAVSAVTDRAVIESSILIVRRIVEELAVLREAIAQHDKSISQLAHSHPDCAVFASLPGAGPVMAPRLIAAFGTQRDRYATASAIQCYAGVAPVTESSGKQKLMHWRWSCPKFLRQTFHEWAWISTKKSKWARISRPPARARQSASRRRASPFLQVAAHCLSLLEGSRAVR